MVAEGFSHFVEAPMAAVGSLVKHTFGCHCSRPCEPEYACETASQEWNRIRASFAQADALGSLASSVHMIADGSYGSDFQEIARAIREAAETFSKVSPRPESTPGDSGALQGARRKRRSG